jgi:hypothetical protein
MTTPDTDEEDLKTADPIVGDGDQPANDQDQTHDDTVDARPADDAEPAEDADDGTDDEVTQDPLLLAQMEPVKPKLEQSPKADAAKAKPETPKAKDPKAETPKTKAPDNTKPEDDDQKADDADLKAALERIADEDWQKVSHKTKSQILSMQRQTRIAQAAVTKAKSEAEQASKDYHEVDTFRQRHGLDPREFMQAISLGGALKAGRKDAIPFLEQTLDALKKHHGIQPEVKTETFSIDADELATLAQAAEEFDLDAIGKLKALAAKAKEAKAGKPATPPPQPQQPQNDRQQQQQSRTDNAEQAEFGAIHDTLAALGVSDDQMEGHITQLLKDITGGDATRMPRAGERLKAVVRAHNARVQAAKPPAKPKPPVTTPPLSGRTGGTARQAGNSDPTKPVDPLAIALRR